MVVNNYKVKFIFVYVLLTDFVLNSFSKIIYIYIRENIFNIKTISFVFKCKIARCMSQFKSERDY